MFIIYVMTRQDTFIDFPIPLNRMFQPHYNDSFHVGRHTIMFTNAKIIGASHGLLCVLFTFTYKQ